MFTPTVLLSFVASALAYQVTYPTQTQGWTNQGAQLLSWQRVDTDPSNFTALLVNQNTAILPTSEVLDALVDGTLGTVNVNPPSAGWPVGSGFQVNFVKDPEDLTTIYAQSPMFSINSSTSTSTSSASIGSFSTNPATIATIATTTPITSVILNPTSSSTSKSGASISAVTKQSTIIGLVALVGFALV